MISCIYFQRWTEKTCYVFLGSFLPEEMQLFSSRVKGRDAPKFHPRCPACRSNAVWVLTSRLLAAYRSLLGLASPKDGISWDWVEAKILKNCKKKNGPSWDWKVTDACAGTRLFDLFVFLCEHMWAVKRCYGNLWELGTYDSTMFWQE